MSDPTLWIRLVIWTTAYLFVFFLVLAIIKGAAYIPAGRKNIRRILDLAKPTATDVLLDLGSGDGRILFAAAASGARCIGIEINPFLHYWCRLRARLSRTRNVECHWGDFWKFDLAPVSVLIVYCAPIQMQRLSEKILREMKPGSRVVSVWYAIPQLTLAGQDAKVMMYRVGGAVEA